jgi:hypothetical protein
MPDEPAKIPNEPFSPLWEIRDLMGSHAATSSVSVIDTEDSTPLLAASGIPMDE